jgi:pimeloyl-ACP methyl ester carboxylesterase
MESTIGLLVLVVDMIPRWAIGPETLSAENLEALMPSPVDLPPGVESQQIETSRLRTHVLTAGSPDAPPLVLVHGNVSAARFFAETMAALARDFRCVAPDLRGFGRSERAPVDARRGVRDFSDDLHALLTEGGVAPRAQPVHLLGWSLGGGVALQYATDHPGTVGSIVLESPMSPFGFGGTRDAGGTPCWPDYAGSGGGTASPEMVRRIEAGDRGADDQTSPRQVLTHLYGNPVAVPPAVEDALVEAMLEMAIGPGNYPGDTAVSENWPGVAPGNHGVNNAMDPR